MRERGFEDAARFLIWDGYYGPVTPKEFFECDGKRAVVRSREEAIRLVNEHASKMPSSYVTALKDIYGRFPI